jgi:Mrp family chromosome partitioning ATPase
MSKIFEALENAQADARAGDVRNEATAPGPVADHAGESTPAMFSRVSMEEEMVSLRQRLDALLPDHAHRTIEFIGSREGEGTSTVVYEFARISATRFGQRVLLLEMDRHPRFQGRPGIGFDGALADAMPPMAGGATLDIEPLPQELLAASRTTDSPGPAAAWARLRTAYDLVLIDAPPATTSPQGLAVASQVDGVVLVLAAEDTRWPVAERVKQSIERSGGRVLGVVLNKRQCHIPQFIYKRL